MLSFYISLSQFLKHRQLVSTIQYNGEWADSLSHYEGSAQHVPYKTLYSAVISALTHFLLIFYFSRKTFIFFFGLPLLVFPSTFIFKTFCHMTFFLSHDMLIYCSSIIYMVLVPYPFSSLCTSNIRITPVKFTSLN